MDLSSATSRDLPAGNGADLTWLLNMVIMAMAANQVTLPLSEICTFLSSYIDSTIPAA